MIKSKGFENRVNAILESLQEQLEREERKFNRVGGTLAIECDDSNNADVTNTVKDAVGSFIEKPFEKVCKLNTHNKRIFVRFKREVHC